jgi:hypothetical protein
VHFCGAYCPWAATAFHRFGDKPNHATLLLFALQVTLPESSGLPVVQWDVRFYSPPIASATEGMGEARASRLKKAVQAATAAVAEGAGLLVDVSRVRDSDSMRSLGEFDLLAAALRSQGLVWSREAAAQRRVVPQAAPALIPPPVAMPEGLVFVSDSLRTI